MSELDLQPKTIFGITPKQEKQIVEQIDTIEKIELPTLTLNPVVKPNFIGETFDEFKGRIFEENTKKLIFLMDSLPEKFVNCEVKKHAGRFIQLNRAGMKVLELFNHDVLYFCNDEFTDFLKQHISDKLSTPFIPSQK